MFADDGIYPQNELNGSISSMPFNESVSVAAAEDEKGTRCGGWMGSIAQKLCDELRDRCTR